jgi:hypothetical protein
MTPSIVAYFVPVKTRLIAQIGSACLSEDTAELGQVALAERGWGQLARFETVLETVLAAVPEVGAAVAKHQVEP